MRPLQTREAEDALILTIDDPAGVNDGQSDEYRIAVYQMLAERPRPRLILDLGQVEFLSSSGIAFLITLHRRIASAQGALVLCRVNSYVLGSLRTMHLASLFQFADDEASGLALLPSIPTD